MAAGFCSRNIQTLIVAIFFLAIAQICSQALASPEQQFEEEKIKDQEARDKVRVLIEKRKAEEQSLKDHPITAQEIKDRQLVEVEPVNVLSGDLSSVYKLLPYKIRRPKWGQQFGVSYSGYTPNNYKSDYIGAGSGIVFSDLYGKAETPLIELAYGYKYNFDQGSLTAEFGAGYYGNTANAGTVIGDSVLTIEPIRLGLRFTADNLFFEPYIAPYIEGGIYSVLYSEKVGNVNFSGNTQLAPFYSAGILFQLNWLDPISAVTSYTESGLENSYVFLEVRQFMKSSAGKDPDFSNDPALGGGINFEF